MRMRISRLPKILLSALLTLTPMADCLSFCDSRKVRLPVLDAQIRVPVSLIVDGDNVSFYPRLVAVPLHGKLLARTKAKIACTLVLSADSLGVLRRKVDRTWALCSKYLVCAELIIRYNRRYIATR